MKPNSIVTRKQMYFQLLALLDKLWNFNFQHQEKLNNANSKRIKNIQNTTERLVLLEQQPSLPRLFGRPRLEHNETTQEATLGKT